MLLSIGIGRDYMRVAFSGWEDAVELRLVEGYWAAEDGERIEIESIVMCGESDSEGFAAARPLATPAWDLAESLHSVAEFSTELYRPRMRLEDSIDLSFLGSFPGFTQKTATRLRKEHCRVFRAYLRYLETDFQAVRRAIKTLMLQSETDRPDLAALLLRSQFTFTCGLLKVQLRVMLYSHGIGTVSVGDLLKRLDQMSLELRGLIPNVVTSES